MKTIIEWYGMLPEPLKSQAFTNAMKHEKYDIFTHEVADMYNAIDRGMIWSQCAEGETFWEEIASRWDNDTNTLIIPLTFSSSMRTMLRSMRGDCKIANALLKDNYTHTTFANYITMRGELCSYLPNGREHIVNENGKWARNGRQDMKVAKMARNLLTEYSLSQNGIEATDFEKFTNLVKSYISVIGDEDGEGKKMTFDVINGHKIYDAYLDANYSKILGTDTNLFNSCMRYDSCQDYLRIYAENMDVISLLVANDSNNMVLGRAILWTMDNGQKAMDTIYAHETLTASFIQWANDNDYFYKSRQSCHHNEFDKHLTNGYISSPCVTLKKYRFDEYPYMDTLSILEDGKLKTEADGKDYKILKSTDGAYEESNSSVFDVYNQCDINEDDATYVDYTRPNGQYFEGHVNDNDLCMVSRVGWVLSCDCVSVNGIDYLREDDEICYVSTQNEWYLVDDCRQDYNGEWIHEDDAVELYNGDFAHEDEASQCLLDGEYYINNDMTEFDGGMVHNGNIDAYHELKFILNTKNTIENETKIA